MTSPGGVIIKKLDLETQQHINRSTSNFRIAAHHFPTCAIDADNQTRFLKKHIFGKDAASLGYSRYSSNFLSDKKDRPHGNKNSKVWL